MSSSADRPDTPMVPTSSPFDVIGTPPPNTMRRGGVGDAVDERGFVLDEAPPRIGWHSTEPGLRERLVGRDAGREAGRPVHAGRHHGLARGVGNGDAEAQAEVSRFVQRAIQYFSRAVEGDGLGGNGVSYVSSRSVWFVGAVKLGVLK